MNQELTKRRALLKLELAGDVRRQVDRVADALYDLHDVPLHPAADNTDWSTTDKQLYLAARKSYDEIIAAFTSDPKVYKFESTREKIWKYNELLSKIDFDAVPEEITPVREEAESRDKPRKKNKHFSRKAEKAAKETAVVLNLDPTDTYLDPFQHPNYWVKQIENDGSESYLNKRTGETAAVRPQVWAEKLDHLNKLSPR